MTDNPLGRVRLHDRQSRLYPYVRSLVRAGYSVRHRMDSPNVDQFYTSGCVGFSGANMLNCAVAKRSRLEYNRIFLNDPAWGLDYRYLDNDDGLRNYCEATTYDPFDWTFPPTDEGSSSLGLMKFWQKNNIIRDYTWCFTFQSFIAALQKQPVLVGTNWYERMGYPSTQGVSLVGGDPMGGHEYLANAILWKDRLVGFENSWGEAWGMRGRFYLSFDDTERLLAEGGDAVVPRLL